MTYLLGTLCVDIVRDENSAHPFTDEIIQSKKWDI